MWGLKLFSMQQRQTLWGPTVPHQDLGNRNIQPYLDEAAGLAKRHWYFRR